MTRTLVSLIALFTSAATPAAHAEVRDGFGLALSAMQLDARLARADIVVLGELHDNPHHHTRRAAMLRALAARKPTLVVEQLDAGATLDPRVPLTAALAVAGFDHDGWKWPMHEPLFTAARAAGLIVVGGNLPNADARRIAREGAKAIPVDLARLLAAAPLPATASAALDRQLVDSHCGHALGAHTDALRNAQRARDAQLAATVLDARLPVVLIVGNGHARRDYGVPQLLARLLPTSSIVSVGFVEDDDEATVEPYDFVVATPRAERDDPCRTFAKKQVPP